ncbi:MAG: hypothetical protein UT33_C0006G0034 [Candidatus Peregrinibacteria bacterium GW2011_GWC2_39_14]|nr:MAG: hypothetical protein UT33_C0006G0034 [Candidatus Peregrinibacteria bacterium GW2011_GWC2_39_14]
MSHIKYLTTIGIAGIIAWLGFFITLTKLNPFESTGMAMTFFFLTLFIALMCTFTILGFYFRVWIYRNEIYYKHINISLRQGVMLSLIAIISLALQLLGVLNWLSGLLLVIVMLLIEAYISLKS